MLRGPRARTSFFAPLVLLTFSYAAHAAGYYAESFASDPPAGWVEAVDSWNVTGGYYKNENSGPSAMAYYSERRWGTDFTYSLRMNSDLAGTGERRVGMVFNVVDQNNYYLVTITMAGTIQQNVQLYHVIGGQKGAALATGHSDIPTSDTWFDVVIVRSGVNTVKVRIGNETVGNHQEVLNYTQLPSAPVGYIGVLVEYNFGRFDDVKVVPAVFRTGFNTGVNLTTPFCSGPIDPGPPPTGQQTYKVDLTGTEDGTGTVWPPTFWGPPSQSLMHTILACTYQDGTTVKPFANYLDVILKGVTSPYGDPTRVLVSTVKDIRHQPETWVLNQRPRLGLAYGPEVGDVPWRFYVRRYIKYVNVNVQQPATTENLANPGPNRWFAQHEFKNTTCDSANPPRRLTLYWETDGQSRPLYRLTMDRNNSFSPCDPADFTDVTDPITFPEQTCFANGTDCPQWVVGQWFYDEYFVEYSQGGTSGDRVAYAINGRKVFDYTGPIRTSRARGIKLTPGYLNIPNVEVRVDDLEVFHHMPCHAFPCGPPPHY